MNDYIKQNEHTRSYFEVYQPSEGCIVIKSCGKCVIHKIDVIIDTDYDIKENEIFNLRVKGK